MGLLRGIYRSKLSAEMTRDPADDRWYAPAPWLSVAGVPVTPELLLNLSAIWKGMRVWGDALGSMPCHLYEYLAGGGRARARTEPLYRTLRWQPNPWQTAHEFWELVTAHVVLRANAFIEIVSAGRQGGVFLIPRHPARMVPKLLPSGRMQYRYTHETGEERTYSQDEIMHVRGFGLDGVAGLEVSKHARTSMGAALAADEFSARFFSQGASPALAVIHPAQLGEDGLKNLGQSVEGFVTGLARAHGVLPLEEGVKIEQIGVDPEKAQLLSTRELSTEEAARWVNLPAYMLGSVKTPTFASAKQYRQDLVDFHFRPMANRFEQAIMRDLITDDRFYAEFLFEAILRGYLEARTAYYRAATGGHPWMSGNEVREFENLNPRDECEEIKPPLNLGRQGGNVDGGNQTVDRTARATAIVREAATRLVRKEISAVAKAAQRHANDAVGWEQWLGAFYEEHAAVVAQTLQVSVPAARAYAAKQGAALVDHGVATMADWEWMAVNDLAALALEAPTAA